MSASFTWLLLTIGMIICFMISVSLSIMQKQSFKRYLTSRDDDTIYKDKYMLICLYGVYLSGTICSLQCILNHISSYFPWYCVWGMSICVIFHEAAKTFGYFYFLCRANAMTKLTKINILPSYISIYVLPIYISLYFILYSIICPLTFRGLSVDPHRTSTSCLFDEYGVWIFYLSVGIELFNSIFFVLLFAYPLYKLMEHSDIKDIKKIIRYNVIFSTICCISSVLFCIYRALSRDNTFGHYIWMMGNIDLIINAIATFLMPDPNRIYIQSIISYISYCTCCHCNISHPNASQSPLANTDIIETPPDDTTNMNDTTLPHQLYTNKSDNSLQIGASRQNHGANIESTRTITMITLPQLKRYSITPLNISTTC